MTMTLQPDTPTLHTGAEYGAAFKLSDVELMMGGAHTIKTTLEGAGFVDVVVDAKPPPPPDLPPKLTQAPGANVWAKGVWNKPDQPTDQLKQEPHVVAVALLKPAPPRPPQGRPPGPAPQVNLGQPPFPTNIPESDQRDLIEAGRFRQGDVQLKKGDIWAALLSEKNPEFEKFFDAVQYLTEDDLNNLGHEDQPVDACNGYLTSPEKAHLWFQGVWAGGFAKRLTLPPNWIRAVHLSADGNRTIWTQSTDPPGS